MFDFGIREVRRSLPTDFGRERECVVAMEITPALLEMTKAEVGYYPFGNVYSKPGERSFLQGGDVMLVNVDPWFEATKNIWKLDSRGYFVVR